MSTPMNNAEMELMMLGAALYGTNTDGSRIIANALGEMERLKEKPQSSAFEIRTLKAVITLSEKELAREDWVERPGALKALLVEALEILRKQLAAIEGAST
jgi:hypothetical protein